MLTQLPDPPAGVSRKDIFRLGFRFIGAADGELTDKFPVSVQNGACLAADNQMIFDWSYPGQLAGWSPVRFEPAGDQGATITFGRRWTTKLPYDQIDLELACQVMFLDTSDRMRQLLEGKTRVNIRIVKGLAGGLGWVGLYNIQEFQIINDTCVPAGTVMEG